MITANEARKLSDEILKPVSGSIEFKAVMAQIDRDIRRAVKNGLEEITIKTYLLPVYNNYKFPKCVNLSKIDKDDFWWPYVKTELEKLGFKIFSTIVHETYKVAW
jgi:hypothetical protein